MDLKISEVLQAQFNETTPVKEKIDRAAWEFTLNKLEEEGLIQRLTGLIDEITIRGNRIAEYMDIRDLKSYRACIAEFVNEVVTHSHEFSRENFLDRRGRHRVYGIVRLINKDLDELAQELLKSEKDHIKILEKTDQIRGLLLDILI